VIYIELFAFKNPTNFVVICLLLEVGPWEENLPRVPEGFERDTRNLPATENQAELQWKQPIDRPGTP
jgi:hypothetical protein